MSANSQLQLFIAALLSAVAFGCFALAAGFAGRARFAAVLGTAAFAGSITATAAATSSCGTCAYIRRTESNLARVCASRPGARDPYGSCTARRAERGAAERLKPKRVAGHSDHARRAPFAVVEGIRPRIGATARFSPRVLWGARADIRLGTQSGANA